MKIPAAPPSTTASSSPACTTFLVVTRRSDAITMVAARIPKAICWAIIGGALLLLLGAGFERQRVGHRLHPLAELVLVVEEVGDARLGVLELRAPEQGVERAHL